MAGRDDDDKPPFDDGDDWIDRDDDTAPGPLVDRDDDELFGAEPPPREPAFPEERDYPEVPDWDDEVSDPDSLPQWDSHSADNDDLNRLAARELDDLGDDPYPPEPDEPLPPMSTGRGPSANAPSTASDFVDRDRYDVSDEYGDDSWSDASEPSPEAYRGADSDAGRGIPARGVSGEDPGGDPGWRRWPIAMLAIAAVAVVLLGVGGYGVISERTALEGEIRALQAQLATAVSPEEARASRDAQQATEQENAALEAELDALRLENAELQQAVSDMEARIAAQEEETEKAVAAAQEAAGAAARRSTASAPSAPAGDWFVNFGSYARADDARRWADRLEVDSGRVVVQDARSRGETIYRVRVVGLADKNKADSVARRLESQHKLPKLWVGKD